MIRKCMVAGMAAMMTAAALAQDGEHHRRGYKPLPELAVVTVHVVKGFNGKPMENAAVIFHAVRDGRDDGNLEVKTDPSGDAKIDLLEVGSVVKLQVIASGYATYATEFSLDAATKQMTVKLERPRAQITAYGDNEDRASVRPMGVQEPPHNDTAKRVAGITGGSFSGTVKDTNGARIPGAIVKIQQLAVAPMPGTATQPGAPNASGIALGDHTVATPAAAQLVATSTYSDASGVFHKRALPVGHYRVEISAPGFRTQVFRDVVLVNGDDFQFDKPMVTLPGAATPDIALPR